MESSSRLQQLLEMYTENSNDSFILFALAKEYEQLDQIEHALKHYEELRQKDKDYVGLYFHYAHLYVQLEDVENALKIYNEGIQTAVSQNDLHALSELKNAKLNFEMEFGL